MKSPVPIELVDAFGIGVYLLFAFVHLDHWRHRRERLSHLWVAGASLGALLVDATGMLLRVLQPDEPAWLAGINILGVVATTSCLAELVSSLRGRPSGRVTRAVQLAALLYALAAWALVKPRLVPVVLVCCFYLLAVAMIRALRSGLRGDRESRTLAAGLLVLLTTLLADVLMELRVLPHFPGLPILGFTALFLTAARALNERSDREYRELTALRAELESRVRDRTQELEAANRQLAEMSRLDALTSLLNRRGFLEAATREITRAARSGEPWSIVMGDLDHFKQVNDRLGHAAGDAVLRDAAEVVRRAVRAQDLVGRWGGEELIFFLPATDAAGALHAAEAVRRAVAAHAYPHGSPMTISLGVAECREGDSLDATINAADRALYRAKQEGRNRVA